jgi:hypothetical protein
MDMLGCVLQYKRERRYRTTCPVYDSMARFARRLTRERGRAFNTPRVRNLINEKLATGNNRQ